MKLVWHRLAREGAHTRTAPAKQVRGWYRHTVLGLLGSAFCACRGPTSPPIADVAPISDATVVAPPETPTVKTRAPLPVPPAPKRTTTGPVSRSIGPPQGGALEDAASIPRDHAAIALMPATTRRNALWGHAGLVDATVRAARRIAERFPGSVLHVGDLSLPTGGSLSPHASHTNGRDIDLAFYLAGLDGQPSDRPMMQRVLDDGRVAGEADLRFDRERNWALVEAFLRDPEVQVQWIFVARHVRAQLLDHAAAVGADPVIIKRATVVMLEPRDSSSHDDHFHIRIYCNRNDRVRGCLDAPPFHAWVDDHAHAVAEWYAGVRPFLGLQGTEEFRWAIDHIARNLARNAIADLESLPTPADPADAALVRDVLAFLKGRSHTTRWETLMPTDSAP